MYKRPFPLLDAPLDATLRYDVVPPDEDTHLGPAGTRAVTATIDDERTGTPVRAIDLLEQFAHVLSDERDRCVAQGWDEPVTVSGGRKLSVSGDLHLYAFDLPPGTTLMEDLPVTLLPSGDEESTEGYVVGRRGQAVLLQIFDSFGPTIPSATIVPDASGFFETASQRLMEMATKSSAYTLGPAERLIPWLRPDESTLPHTARGALSSAVFTTVWDEEPGSRRTKLAALALELVRSNKRVLLVSPDHQRTDETTGVIARTLRGAGLPFKSLVSRYEIPLQTEAAGVALHELGFETQMHRFYAKSRAGKAALRRKYDRFRELTPLLAYKAEKQRDLSEVQNLEWRLLAQMSDCQHEIKDIDATLVGYEAFPIWKRLAMQTVGKNVATLTDSRAIYETQIQSLLGEVEVAKHRIEELKPEAALPKDLRPEYDDLKEEMTRLGGTRKIRELLAAQEGTNRLAFIQTKRLVATTAARVIADPLFSRVRFDALIADDGPLIPAAFLLAAAGLVRERIVLTGDTRDITAARAWESAGSALLRA